MMEDIVRREADQVALLGSTSLPEAPPQAKPKRKSQARTEARRLGREHLAAERNRLFQTLKDLPDDAVLLIPEWAALNTLSPRQARRILAEPGGPTVTQLSAKRRGITIRANREWQARKALPR
jgi:hypothetical protein